MSINPRNKSPHASPVGRVFREFLPQPALFVPGFGIKENTQRHGSDQGRPALKEEGRPDGGTKNGSVKRMPDDGVYAVLDQFCLGRRLGKRRQVSPQGGKSGKTTNCGDHEKNDASEE